MTKAKFFIGIVSSKIRVLPKKESIVIVDNYHPAISLVMQIEDWSICYILQYPLFEPIQECWLSTHD